jgi:hypothetical protein
MALEEPMTPDWYYEIEGKAAGPVTAAQLKQLAVGGKLQADHLVWKKGMPKKVPARLVKGLFGEPSKGPAAAKKTASAPAGRVARAGGPNEAAKAPGDDGDAALVEEFVEVDAVEEIEDAKPRMPAAGGRKAAPPASVKPLGGAPRGKAFRVLNQGKVSGPHTLAEIRSLLASGKLGNTSLIGFETWLPAATFQELAASGPGLTADAGAMDVEEVVDEVEAVEDLDAVEVVEEVGEAPPPAKSAPPRPAPPKPEPAKHEDDLIPVDEEFKIGG